MATGSGATGSGATGWAAVPTGAEVADGSSPQAMAKTEKEAKMRHRNSRFTVADIHR